MRSSLTRIALVSLDLSSFHEKQSYPVPQCELVRGTVKYWRLLMETALILKAMKGVSFLQTNDNIHVMSKRK